MLWSSGPINRYQSLPTAWGPVGLSIPPARVLARLVNLGYLQPQREVAPQYFGLLREQGLDVSGACCLNGLASYLLLMVSTRRLRGNS